MSSFNFDLNENLPADLVEVIRMSFSELQYV